VLQISETSHTWHCIFVGFFLATAMSKAPLWIHSMRFTCVRSALIPEMKTFRKEQ